MATSVEIELPIEDYYVTAANLDIGFAMDVDSNLWLKTDGGTMVRISDDDFTELDMGCRELSHTRFKQLSRVKIVVVD